MSDDATEPADRAGPSHHVQGHPARHPTLRRRRSRSAAGPPTRGQTSDEPTALLEPDPQVRTSAIPEPADPAQEAAPTRAEPQRRGNAREARKNARDVRVDTQEDRGKARENGGNTRESRGTAREVRADVREDGPRRDRRRQRPDNGADGPWRELAGSGRSQVTQSAAMRARDADQPTEDDLARAEREVVVQRRHWTPGT